MKLGDWQAAAAWWQALIDEPRARRIDRKSVV